MSTESLISRERAIELARARHDEKWRPVPGYPSGAPMATSYRMDRYESGWIFSPVVVTRAEPPDSPGGSAAF